MRIGVIGCGAVGRATARAYSEFVDEVRAWDAVAERSTHTHGEVCACQLVYVCVPEGAVEGTFERLPRHGHYVLKATVPVGTTRGLRALGYDVVHQPEFLTARSADFDSVLPAVGVFGFPSGMTDAARYAVDAFAARHPGVPVMHLDSDESEAVKLMLNAFFAVKVAFWNEMRTWADRRNLRWDKVLGAVLMDGRVSPFHTRVPGPDGKRGFGGPCLPKDLAGVVRQLLEAGLAPLVCAAALERNQGDRKRADRG